MPYNDTPLVSREVSIRKDQEQKLKETQHREMESRQVERDFHNFNQSLDAHNDRYMIDALTQVRKSNVTLPDELTRKNGTWMHNRSIRK